MSQTRKNSRRDNPSYMFCTACKRWVLVENYIKGKCIYCRKRDKD